MVTYPHTFFNFKNYSIKTVMKGLNMRNSFSGDYPVFCTRQTQKFIISIPSRILANMTPQNRYLFYNLFAYEGKKIAGNQL